jgi:hypothetical protein
LAEIAADNFGEIAAVLNEDGPIEAESVAKFDDLAGRGTFTKHLFGRITGNDVNEKKDEGEHKPQCGECEQKTVEDVTKHEGGSQCLSSIVLRLARAKAECASESAAGGAAG